MLDWDVAKEEDRALPPVPDAEEPRRRRPIPWRVVAVGVLLLVAGVAGAVRWRLVQQERLLRADLLAVVRQEERVRAAGQPNEARALVAQGVDAAWLAGYLRTFEPTGAPPQEHTVTLGEIESTQTGALVEVVVDGDRYVRAYERQGLRWRRTQIPLDEWGATSDITVGDITLTFAERDRAFAEQLAAELSTWRAERWNQWALPYTINLVAREFDAILLEGGTSTAGWVPSPLTIQREGTLDGEETVRLVLGRFLRPLPSADQQIPQSAPRMRAALREVAALRTALSPDEYAARVAAWKAAAGEWQSPFFVAGVTRPEINSWTPNPIEASSLLAAHVLYDRLGATGVAELALASTTHQSWDDLFHQRLDRYVVQLENEIRVALGEPPTEDALFPQGLPRFPQEVTLLDGAGNDFFSAAAFDVDLAGDGTDAAVRVDASTADVRFPDGSPATIECVTRYRRFEVDGDWTEPGIALHATAVRLLDSAPPPLTIPVAPPDTIAYGIGYTLSERGTPSPPRPTLLLIAIDSEGHADSALFETTVGQILPLDVPVGVPTQWLIAMRDEACQQLWLYRYEAGRGITATWNTPPSTWDVSEIHWDPTTLGVLVVVYDTKGAFYGLSLNDGNAGHIVPAGGEIPGTYRIIGWREGSNAPLVVHRSVGTLGTLDVPTGVVTPLDPPRTLSGVPGAVWVEGHSIYYYRMSNGTFYLLDLDSGESLPLGQADAIEAMIARRGHPLMAWIRAADTSGERMVTVQDRSTGHAYGWQVPASQQVAAQLCGDNQLLYVAGVDSERQLYRWTPDDGTAPETIPVQLPDGVALGNSISCP